MAIKAGILCDQPIARLDLNGLVELAGGKRDGMEQAVVCLRQPLAQKIMWDMTIVASRDMVMARVGPRVQMALHHVTIGARSRIVG